MKALFLDRDGVINEELEGSYILNPDEFLFYDGAVDAFEIFKSNFNLIIIVTNQRCIGKGLLAEETLHEIHEKMRSTIMAKNGVRIDAIYFAPAINDHDKYRKPNIGMALQAKNDFPNIDFSKSTMVGNNISDMKFGKKLGMKTIFLHTTKPKIELPHSLIDEQYSSLSNFAKSLA